LKALGMLFPNMKGTLDTTAQLVDSFL